MDVPAAMLKDASPANLKTWRDEHTIHFKSRFAILRALGISLTSIPVPVKPPLPIQAAEALAISLRYYPQQGGEEVGCSQGDHEVRSTITEQGINVEANPYGALKKSQLKVPPPILAVISQSNKG